MRTSSRKSAHWKRVPLMACSAALAAFLCAFCDSSAEAALRTPLSAYLRLWDTCASAAVALVCSSPSNLACKQVNILLYSFRASVNPH